MAVSESYRKTSDSPGNHLSKEKQYKFLPKDLFLKTDHIISLKENILGVYSKLKFNGQRVSESRGEKKVSLFTIPWYKISQIPIQCYNNSQKGGKDTS